MGHGLRLTFCTAAFVAVASTSHAHSGQMRPEAAREQQWLYRDVLGSGNVQPTAVFLSYDYSAVVFSATCDRRKRELVLRSELETGAEAPSIEPMEISSNSSSVRLRTKLVDGYLEDRTPITKELVSIFHSKAHLEVFVPTEMGEPLYVGHAAPLRKLGLMCRSR